MKKFVLFLGTVVSVFLLSACGQGNIEMLDFVDVNFKGLDTRGTASYFVDHDRLRSYLNENDKELAFESSNAYYDDKQLEEMLGINLDKNSELSNGDSVKLTLEVDSSKVKNLVGGDKEIVVKGLDEPKKLTTGEAEKHLVVNFNGVSGLGSATIDNTLPDDLRYVQFTLVDDGKFKNGDLAKIDISEDLENRLADRGYLLDDAFDPSFEVKGLDEVAEKATDIVNLDDIKRMIDEEVNRSYKDWSPEKSYGSRFEIKEEGLFYRQFTRNNNDSQFSFNSATNNGNLIKIVSVKRYYGGTENKLNSEFTAIIGYSDLFLDEENKVNVADLVSITDTKDSTYSVESVIQLYEGYGYKRVEE